MSHPFETNRVILAPLVGGSDVAYRRLCRHYGAHVTVTEMCVARYYQAERDAGKPTPRFELHPEDRPVVLQLADTTAEPIIAVANEERFANKIDGIDLNLGCPQAVARRGEFGAFLVERRGVAHVAELVRRVCSAVRVPVSAKLRLYRDVPHTIAYVGALFDAGAAAVTVHGRTLHQKGEARGECDWDAIAQIKAAFPDKCVLGNGDVRTFKQLQERLSTSPVNAVMVGYGALRDPTLFGSNNEDLSGVIQRYIDLARQHDNKLIDVKRHVGWLTKAIASKTDRMAIFDARSLEALVEALAALSPSVKIEIPSAEERINDKLVSTERIQVQSNELKGRARARIRRAAKKAAKSRAKTLERIARLEGNEEEEEKEETEEKEESQKESAIDDDAKRIVKKAKTTSDDE